MDRWKEFPNSMLTMALFPSTKLAILQSQNLVRNTVPVFKDHYDDFVKVFDLGERFFLNQLFLWNIHVWLLIRRLEHEKEAVKLIHYVTKLYFDRWKDAHACEDVVKVPTKLKLREKMRIPTSVYAFWLAMDSAIDQEDDVQIIAAIHRNNPIGEHFDNISLQALNNFVFYIRFQMAFLDRIPSERFLSSSWDWPTPSQILS
jgi:hypothetical protein